MYVESPPTIFFISNLLLLNHNPLIGKLHNAMSLRNQEYYGHRFIAYSGMNNIYMIMLAVASNDECANIFSESDHTKMHYESLKFQIFKHC